ncbi:uncharacterized protein LOC128227562 [Mya arenaria]|uniref:uncharacterized protein LOC128227562 n=2 Tax=Mya arenaria TaxID=6604 RepID=UPI0022E00833|nr:uncharacterized protein LOC128227562 [Mya arenaria]
MGRYCLRLKPRPESNSDSETDTDSDEYGICCSHERELQRSREEIKELEHKLKHLETVNILEVELGKKNADKRCSKLSCQGVGKFQKEKTYVVDTKKGTIECMNNSQNNGLSYKVAVRDILSVALQMPDNHNEDFDITHSDADHQNEALTETENTTVLEQKAEINRLIKENDLYKQNIQKLNGQIEEEKLEQRNLIRVYEGMIEELKSKPFNNSDNISQEKILKGQLEDAEHEIREIKLELDETKTRLSKLLGQKLTDKNPNIADLSDKNRPTNLAERYSELYDNQWTDAFDCLNKWHDEATTIKQLSDILKNAMDFCSFESKIQMKQLQECLSFSTKSSDCQIPGTIIKSLKDCRKSLGEPTGHAVYQKYVEHLQQSAPECMDLQVLPYLQECIQLSWLMCIQDPPVVLSPVGTHGSRFDTDVYKAYTKCGPIVDYVVWPALCLHERGPLLCKGIAQGYGGKKTAI